MINIKITKHGLTLAIYLPPMLQGSVVMKNHRFIASLISTLILFFATTSASATIITFDDIPTDYRFENLPSYTENGFAMTVNCTNCVNVFSTIEALSGYGASTGATGWGADERFLETWNTSAVFTLTQIGNHAFNLKGFNIGWFNDSTTNASWTLRAFDAQGNQIGTDDVYTGIGYFALNYKGVFSVEFQSNGGFSSFDNLNVAVTEPSIVGLLGLSLIAAGFRSRRKNRNA